MNGGNMEYRAAGRSGLKMTRFSMGAWLTMGDSLTEKTSYAILDRALDHGINTIDTADIYARGAAETVVGRYITQRNRHQLVVNTKCFWPMSDDPNDRGLSRKHIVESIDRSLKRLQTDYIDLFYCHRFDPNTPMEETIRAMDDMIRQGKILYWGTSCWSSAQLRKAHEICDAYGTHKPIMEQCCYNLLDREVEEDVISTAQELGMGITPFSPLAEGLLTGKYNQGIPEGTRAAGSTRVQNRLTPENLAGTRQLEALATQNNVPSAALALAWLLHQDAVTSVILGATRPEHVDENVKALEFALESDLLTGLNNLFAR
jgi:voltage-dependent potassium channel beta subunit